MPAAVRIVSPHRSLLAALSSLVLALSGCAATPGGAAATPPAAAEPASAASVRPALEAAYARNRAALLARDAEAVLALRTADFRVVTPDGSTHDAAEMAGFTRNLLANVERWDALSFDIESIAMQGEEAAAEVRQHSIRLMRRPGGVTQRVENWVTQRETWVRTPQGWKIARVEDIRDQRVLIDGVPRQ
jgi:hypothetical protein